MSDVFLRKEKDEKGKEIIVAYDGSPAFGSRIDEVGYFGIRGRHNVRLDSLYLGFTGGRGEVDGKEGNFEYGTHGEYQFKPDPEPEPTRTHIQSPWENRSSFGIPLTDFQRRYPDFARLADEKSSY